MIELYDVSRTYPNEVRPALDRVNLTLPDRGLVFIVGPSGAGKTTLVSLIAGMDSGFTGRIVSFGHDLSSMTPQELSSYRAEYVGMSFQDGFLEESIPAYQEVMKPLLASGFNSGEAKDRSQRILDDLGLGDLSSRKVSELSGGERKRVSLAKALVKEPALAILDEPTSGLNPALASKVMRILRARAKNSLILVVTHDASIVDRGSCIYVKDGRVSTSCLVSKASHRRIDEASKVSSSWFAVFSDAIKGFFRGFKHLSWSLFAMALAVTVAGFSIMMVSGVGDGMKQVVGTSLDQLSAVVQPRYNENADNPDGIYLSPEEISPLINLKPEATLGYGGWYLKGVNGLFDPSSGFRVVFGNWKYPRDLGMDILAQPSLLAARPDASPFPADALDEPLDDDSVLLGVDSGLFESLMNRADGSEGLKTALNEGQITLQGQVTIPNVQGEKEFSLKVRALFSSNRVEVVHSDPLFASRFFEGELEMVSSCDMDSLDPLPYTIKKAGVVWVKRDNLGDFFRSFQLSNEWGDYVLVRVRDQEGETAVGVGAVYKRTSEASPRDCLDIYLNSGGRVVDYGLSSPVYTYVSGGMYEGFSTPLFVSPNREDLNVVMDQNSLTDFDLTGYSFADGELPESVVSSSLADSIMGDGIAFSTPSQRYLVSGQVPASDSVVAVSEGLAKELYGSSKKALGSVLNLLMLESVRKVQSGYSNGFMEATLRVCGIFSGDDLALVHDAFFPQALAFQMSDMPPQASVCDAFVLRFSSTEAMDEVILELMEKYPQYSFSTPVRDMVESLDETISQVGRGLGIFGALSVTLAFALLTLSLTLAVKRSERRMGDMLSLGFTPGQVQAWVVIQALAIGLVASIQSAIGLGLAYRIAESELASIFSTEGLLPLGSPIAAAVAICLAACLISGIVTSLKARWISPLKAFRKR